METVYTVGKRYTFCKHYPDGYVEPFECAECAETAKTLPTYHVAKVDNNSLVLSTGEKQIEVKG